MAAITDTALTLGYEVMHIPDRAYGLAASQGRYDALWGARGFPDLVIVGHGTLFVIECKSATGRTSPEQDAWLAAFSEFADAMCPECSTRVYVLLARPADQDHIMGLLRYHREQSWRQA